MLLQAPTPPAPPPAAVSEQYLTFRTMIRCAVNGAEGTLNSCKVLKEDPPHKGYGAAALKLSSQFRMKPKTADGRPLRDGFITIPVTFKIPLDASGKPIESKVVEGSQRSSPETPGK